jgi:hypothetical protein
MKAVLSFDKAHNLMKGFILDMIKVFDISLERGPVLDHFFALTGQCAWAG